MHITDAGPARTLIPGQGNHGSVAPGGEAEFELGEGEVHFGSAGMRSSSEGALPAVWRAGTLSRLCLQGLGTREPHLSLHLPGSSG